MAATQVSPTVYGAVSVVYSIFEAICVLNLALGFLAVVQTTSQVLGRTVDQHSTRHRPVLAWDEEDLAR